MSTQANPANPTYAYHLGVAYSKAGEITGAKESFERAVKTGGESGEAREAEKALAWRINLRFHAY